VIDFDALLVGPAIAVFGARVLYGRGAAADFAVGGIFDRVHLDIGFNEAGAPLTTVRTQVSVQLATFPAGFAPAPGDRVKVALVGSRQVDADAPPSGAELLALAVADVQRDGVGGALLILTGRTAA
jgi:hypothetical protein